MWKITFDIFIKSLRFETPWVRKNSFNKILSFFVSEKNFLKKSKILILGSDKP